MRPREEMQCLVVGRWKGEGNGLAYTDLVQLEKKMSPYLFPFFFFFQGQPNPTAIAKHSHLETVI